LATFQAFSAITLKEKAVADNEKLILNLFASMQDALFLGDHFDNGEFVSFMQPGQFVSLNLQETNASDDMAIQSQICNVLIDSSYVNQYQDVTYSNSKLLPGSVNQVYEDIMTKEALPYEELSPDTLAQINTLQTWLIDNRANYKLYEGYYNDAVEAYNEEAAKPTPDPSKLSDLSQAENDAMTDWIDLGLKTLYENNEGQLEYLTAPSPAGFWADLAQQLTNQKRTAPRLGNYYQTFLEPPIIQWPTAGWATFEQKISEDDSYSYSKETSWSGGVSADFGLFSFGGGSSGSTNYQYQQSSVSNVSLKFDYLRVRIIRQWMVQDVFGYKFWTWKKVFGGQMVSDGGNLAVTPPVRPIGRMPVLTDFLIVVRNVELSASFSSNEATFYQQQIQANASVGWGPFSLSGSYSEASGSQYTQASFDGVTFRIPQPQIIAMTGLMIPRSPDPDQTLPWQGDQWFPSSNDELAQQLAKNTKLLREQDYQQSVRRVMLAQAEADATRIRTLWLEQRKREISLALQHGHVSRATQTHAKKSKS
jgi:hypothetical protein